MFNLEEQLKNLPDKPGVYIMKDEYGQIIYIGKAVSLKNRVRQYFQNSRGHGAKVKAMVDNIEEFEYIVTDSELEALILECNLIKTHKPKYNVLLKDDKHYPYIKVTMNEDYPRVVMIRKIERDKARYFGPYSGAFAVRETIEIIKKLFPIRTCSRVMGKNTKERPCLNFHIGRCLAPCQGNVNIQEYRNMMKDICLFLSGSHDELISELEKKMNASAENMEYERAADYRDKIAAIRQIQEKQKVLSSAMEDEDVIAFAQGEDKTCMQVFFIRGGKLIGREHFILTDTLDTSTKEILTGFIKQFYMGEGFIPREILLQEEIDEINIIESWLTSKRGSKVYIKIPQKGEKKDLVDLASKNALITLQNFSERILRDKKASEGAIEELSDILELDFIPRRIEAFDISNIQGTDPVGSMVVFVDGKPQNREYRRFRIKTVKGPNDYASMMEMLSRRFKHGLEEIDRNKGISDGADGKFSNMPDLILIDGGEGHVNSALEVVKGLNLDIPVCGMVKDDRHRTRGLIYNSQEIKMDTHSEAFRLVTRIQDEVHRFAINYHRSLRDKGMNKSVLDEINGIGSIRKKALIKHFGSIDKIKEANADELLQAPGMNKKSAQAVYGYFHGN
ncbi:UvrABC system protein C [Oxobacter pfennigii]|uniref:UvrABC system protein C n=1 Tax=Oxobacter pfennigii TaxID=36849 RepID=A0A0P8WYH0_9CLOT|nr:excinuclease ABC subunit UvrC [Oxobacter pfennigii]KPU43433.1 UvrABC system protein C [Oxobacter pfennigii]